MNFTPYGVRSKGVQRDCFLEQIVMGTVIVSQPYFSSMRRMLTGLSLMLLLQPTSPISAQAVIARSVRDELTFYAKPLSDGGEAELLREADQHQYFLFGELHGENEVPELLSRLWPSMWREGYRHVAAEVSPWAAIHLQMAAKDDPTPVSGLWTRQQTAEVTRFASPGQLVLWGCDIEEEQPGRLINQAATINRHDDGLQSMAAMIASGYSRKQAPELLRIAEAEHPVRDDLVGGTSLWKEILDTLQVEALRADPQTRYAASDVRERVMKKLFLAHIQQEGQGKVLLRFGRNHLHRGIDARGISTLGNFVSELALAQRQSVVNVGVFAAGGKEHLAGQTFSADERQDELTFALLAELSGRSPTLFDLRSLRPKLHAIPLGKRTSLETNLIYWADSYDYLLCYPMVTPLMDLSADLH